MVIVLVDIGEAAEFVPGNVFDLDGFWALVLMIVFLWKPKLVIGLYNACLPRNYFSREWKVDVLSLFLKDFFRDFGHLLPFFSKVLERLVVSNLYLCLQGAGYVSGR